MDTLKKLMEICISRYFLLTKAKKKIKENKELWIKIRDLIRSITKYSADYDEKFMKIKFTSDDEFSLNKTIEIPSMAIVVTAICLKITNIIHKFF